MIDWLADWLVDLAGWLAGWLVRSFMYLYIHVFMHSFICSFIHYPFNHSFRIPKHLLYRSAVLVMNSSQLRSGQCKLNIDIIPFITNKTKQKTRRHRAKYTKHTHTPVYIGSPSIEWYPLMSSCFYPNISTGKF